MTADAWIDALLAPDGQALLGELAAEGVNQSDTLHVITRYRGKYPQELVAAALTQQQLRVRARAKFSRAAEMYFTAPGLEQASTERMAQHHARRYAPFDRVADLCSGIGGDLLGLAANHEVVAVDFDPVHARLGALNAGINGVGANVHSVCADVRDVVVDSFAAAFIDPARRSADRRFTAGTSDPSLEWCFALAGRGTALGVKAAPGLPTEMVPGDWEVEFVSEHRELKESVLWSPSLATTRRRATLLPTGDTLTDRIGAHLEVKAPGRYLLDPDPSVTRAGLVAELGESLGDVWKIDEQVAFISSNQPVASPFGRTLEILASMPWSLSKLKDALRLLHIGTVDIRKRGSAVDVDEIQKRLKLKGGKAATVVLTRVSDKPWAFVCAGLDPH